MAGILTAAGEAKVALSIGGTAIAFAALRIGDGNGAPIVPNRLMTDLVRRVGGAYPVIASARDPENPTHWRVTTEIPAGEGPFNCREIAVFDSAGDMIAIAAHPTVEFTGPGGDQLSIITDIVFPVSGAANIAVTISPSALMPITRNLRPFWLAVESASVTAPPANPAVGASYIIPADATGAWAGQAGAVAQWTGDDWAIANVPVGHVACIIDQALNTAGRYLRRAAEAWVPAEATDLAFGFARRATAYEIEVADGNGFVTPAQMRGQLIWANILNIPNTFPPSPHNHDDRYYTEGEVNYLLNGKSDVGHIHDDRYYTKGEVGYLLNGKSNLGHTHDASETVSGVFSDSRLSSNVALKNAANIFTADQTIRGTWTGFSADRVGVGNSVGYRWLQDGSLRWSIDLAGGSEGNLYFTRYSDVGAFISSPMVISRATGFVGVGTDSPSQRFHVEGALRASSILFPAPGDMGRLEQGAGDGANLTFCNVFMGSWWGIGFGPVSAGHPVPLGQSAQFFDVRNGNMGFRGQLYAGGGADPGASNKVLAGGSPASWKTLSELGVGKKIIAIGRATAASISVSFGAAEPDTSYSVAGYGGWGGAGDNSGGSSTNLTLASKTTTGCTVQLLDEGGVGPSGSTRFFYVIYR